MIYSFCLNYTLVHVYNLPLPYVEEKVLAYSFATGTKTCLGISCSECPIYTDGDCTTKLRKVILNQSTFISNFPELLI